MIFIDINATVTLIPNQSDNDVIAIAHPVSVEVNAIIQLLDKLNWRYINLVTSDTILGRNYLHEFQAQARVFSICLISQIQLPTNDSMTIHRHLPWLSEGDLAPITVLLAESATLQVSIFF